MMSARDDQIERWKSFALLTLRVGVGLYLVVVHGWPKIAGSVGGAGWMTRVTNVLGPGGATFLFAVVSITLELLGGMLAALGVFTRTVSACLALYVTGTYLIGLGPEGLAPILTSGSAVLILLFAGPGRYSVDEYLTPSSDYLVVNSTEMPPKDS